MNEQVAEEVVETTEVEEGPSIEEQATAHGWNAEGVEGKRNLSAEEFMDRQPMYDDIRSLKKSNRRLQEGMEAMKQMQSGIREREREKTIKELQDQKVYALENDNHAAVIAIDDKIAEERAAVQPEANIVFENWIDENEWYNQSSSMKKYADTIGVGYHQSNPNASMGDVYDYVTEEVKQRFPEKFNGGNSPRAVNPVEGATKGRSGNKATRYSDRDLPEEDRQVMNKLLKTGVMTKAEYLKEYFG